MHTAQRALLLQLLQITTYRRRRNPQITAQLLNPHDPLLPQYPLQLLTPFRRQVPFPHDALFCRLMIVFDHIARFSSNGKRKVLGG